MLVSLTLPHLSHSELVKIGERVCKNETGGDRHKLVFWNANESFPSLGIGHFTWRPSNCTDSVAPNVFSDFLNFCQERGIILPPWFQKNPKCPWENREVFMKWKQDQERQLKKMCVFFSFYSSIQAQFIVEKFGIELEEILKKLPEETRAKAIEYCTLLFSTSAGCFALIDYHNFKGSGLKEYPEYNSQGWGVNQLLEAALLNTEWREHPLEVFIQSGKAILSRRVENAPADKQEAERSFLQGWFNRLDGYNTRGVLAEKIRQ